MKHIVDLENYIRSRQKKGKSPTDIRQDLEANGYDMYAAYGLVLRYWKSDDEEE